MCRLSCSLALVFSIQPALFAAEELRVGVAKVDVTPDYSIRLNGFGNRREESEGISQRIWAKALAFGETPENRAVLLTVDSLGVRLGMVDEVARRLREKLGVRRDRVALTFSHSHCTPKVNGAADNIFSNPIPPPHQKHIDRYTKELTDNLERVALKAFENQLPSRLDWSVGQVKFARNRRTAGGPVDHDLPMLVVRSLDEKDVRAIYVSYACHCVTLSFNKISGDWAGYAQELIERKFPGAVALVSIGAGSDSNPSSGVTGPRVDIATAQGAEIASEVARLLKQPLRPLGGPLRTTLRRIPLPLEGPPDKDELEAIARRKGAAGYNARTQLDRLARGEKLLSAIDYPIQTWSFGEGLMMVFLAGEVCVDYSHRLKRELHRDRVWINAYANDFCSYIPSERLAKEGGYGGGAEIPYFALPSKLRPGLEEKIVAEVRRQTPASFVAPPGTQGVPPKSPEESRQSMRTHDDLKIELVAAEPLIADPVAIDFAADGRLWVAEMPDYSHEVDDKFKQTGRVRILADTDRDGRYDRSTVFLTGLRFPTDVKVWRKGVLVCDAPEIFYAEDRDGDGKADHRRVLYKGFATINPHARVNSLRWGLDNWLYGSCGLFGETITSFTDKQVRLGARDFRLRPDTGDIEPVTGRTQQGRVRNDWGDWFGCDNGTLIRHYPVVDRYAKRNPHYATPPTARLVPNYPDSARLFPIGDLVLFKLSGSGGRPTSACGLGIYRDDFLGEGYRGNSFTCEPVNQLVHRLVLRKNGAIVEGRRAESERNSEFLASSDRWFRPVQARTGPDGALWIVDMYRYVIEHPRWIPIETKRELNVMAGLGLGRIYRVAPKDRPRRAAVRLDQRDPAELAAALDTPNGPVRDLAHQMLLWRDDPASVEPLKRLAREGKRAEGRLHALCALDGLRKTDAELLLHAAAHDPHPGVRRHAVRLAESVSDVQRRDAILERGVKDTRHEVVLQAAYSLGSQTDGRLLARLAPATRNDPYLRAAMMSSLTSKNVADLFFRLFKSKTDQASPLLDELYAQTLALAEPADFLAASNAAIGDKRAPLAKRLRRLTLAIRGADRRKLQIGLKGSTFTDLYRTARSVIGDDRARLDIRLAAIDLLASPEAGALAPIVEAARVEDRPAPAEQLSSLLQPQTPRALQSASVKAIVAQGDARGPEWLLSSWQSATPALRAEILDGLLGRDVWTTALLKAVERKQVNPGDFDAARRQRILTHRDAKIRRMAEKLLSSRPGERTEIVDRYLRELKGNGVAARGEKLFAKHCANCHRLNDKGFAIGPDLAALTNRSAVALTKSILDPSGDVDARYLNYIAVNDEGVSVSGLLVDESAASLTIRAPAGKDHVLLRRRIEQLRSTGKSMMPDGLEKEVSPAGLDDLLAYLTKAKRPRKTFPGNRPRTISANADGVIVLPANAAEIRGGDIVFEHNGPFKNIGSWHGGRDHASWSVRVESATAYDVYLDYSCTHESAGNRFRLIAETMSLSDRVGATGGWDRYEQKKIGAVSLRRGVSTIVVEPVPPMRRRALMDLRTIVLAPVGQEPDMKKLINQKK